MEKAPEAITWAEHYIYKCVLHMYWMFEKCCYGSKKRTLNTDYKKVNEQVFFKLLNNKMACIANHVWKPVFCFSMLSSVN